MLRSLKLYPRRPACVVDPYPYGSITGTITTPQGAAVSKSQVTIIDTTAGVICLKSGAN